MLVAVPVLRFRGFGGIGVLFAPPLSGLGEPGGIVLRFGGFLLLLLRVFRDVVVAPVLQAGWWGICQYGGGGGLLLNSHILVGGSIRQHEFVPQ